MSETQAAVELIRVLGSALALAVVVVAALFVGAGRVLAAFVQRRVEAAADEQVQRQVREHGLALSRQLEEYKTRLAVSADAERLTFQRQLHEFGLYAAKRDAVYAKLFARVLAAQGKLGGLYGLRVVPDYRTFVRTEYEEAMRGRVGSESTAQVFAAFDNNDRVEAARLLSDLLYAAEREEAYHASRRAWNYFLLNELYLSERAVTSAREALTAMAVVANLARHAELTSPSYERRENAEAAMNAGVDRLRAVMRAELRRSDYGVGADDSVTAPASPRDADRDPAA